MQLLDRAHALGVGEKRQAMAAVGAAHVLEVDGVIASATSEPTHELLYANKRADSRPMSLRRCRAQPTTGALDYCREFSSHACADQGAFYGKPERVRMLRSCPRGSGRESLLDARL